MMHGDRGPRAAPRAVPVSIALLVLWTGNALLAGTSTSSPSVAGEPTHEAGSSRRDSTRAAVHLLQRATFGARPHDVALVTRIGSEAWLDRQLHPERIDDSALQKRLAAFPAASMSQRELYEAYPPPRVLRARYGDPDSVSVELRREMRMMNPARIAGDLVGAKLQRAVYSERQLEEVMVDFWYNHFNVFFAKGADRWLVADYEASAIRPHVFGRFEDMLTATATHPAMLFYLDNWRNFVPDSLNRGAKPRSDSRRRRGGPSPAQQRGYNENYARELLELHTLGVEGGYTQRDVVEVARALTGWTITRPGRGPADGATGIEFRFVPQLHDPGEKTVLGHSLPGGRSTADGEEVLRLLASHPSTARHIAYKLAERFVADDPPPEAVERIATVFLVTDGDLREVTRAVFQDPAFLDPASRRAKVRSPFELVAASLRLTSAEVGPSRQLIEQLRSMGHMPYLSDVPTGYPETSDEWINGGAMLQRMNYALSLAGGRIRGVRVEAREHMESYSDLARGVDPEAAVTLLAQAFLPGVESRELVEIVVDDLVREDFDGTAATRRAAGLLIGSPEFQRH